MAKRVKIKRDICNRLGTYYTRYAGRTAKIESSETEQHGEKVFALNFGFGEYATLPQSECEEIKPRARRQRSAMDIAAESCGLVKVRGAVSGKIYYE